MTDQFNVPGPAGPASALRRGDATRDGRDAAAGGGVALRGEALDAWRQAEPDAKAAAVLALHARWRDAASPSCDEDTTPAACAAAHSAGERPGRPARPVLVMPRALPSRPPGSEAGRAALLHAIAHIEFNAIDLALDAVWRFDRMPWQYRLDWLSVAADEARHFGMVRDELARRGTAYGDLAAHDGLWQMAARTAHDVFARMALVPGVLEARGLDATPPIQARLRAAGDARAVEILQVILDEEIGHVACGRRWFRWLCARDGVDPVATFKALCDEHDAPRPKPPVNLDARRAAGFDDAELAVLLG